MTHTRELTGPLDEMQRARFARDGFLVVRGLFDADEVRRIREMTEEVQAWPEIPGRYMKYFEKGGNGERLLSRIENFCPYHDGWDDLVRGPRLLGAVSQLFGEPAVLFKDKINFKLAGAGGFAPHQDVQAGWDRYAELHITALVSIDAGTADNGALEMVAGAHDRGLVGDAWTPLTETQIRNMDFQPVYTEPGDAVFFDSYAPHRSGPNRSRAARRVLYVTYNRASAGDSRARYYADKRASYPPDCEREPGREYVFRV